jgi:PRTRC genetic system protein B
MTMKVGSELTVDTGVRNARPTTARIEGALVLSRLGGALMVTHHEIQGSKGKPQIMRGKPVDVAAATSLLEAILAAGGVPQTDGWTPERLLFKNAETMAWWQPAAVRPMYFREGQQRHLYRVPWPTLIFVARRTGHLDVFASRVQTRPTPTTPLYHAPLGNISAAGAMCWGTIAAPAFGLHNLPAYETAVFRTYFTHTNHRQAITDGSGGDALREFYAELHQQKADAFPVGRLVSIKKKLGDILGP